MGWFHRGGAPRGAGGRWRGRTLDREAERADLAHLERFATSRPGVEGYVEPRTAVTAPTIVLWALSILERNCSPMATIAAPSNRDTSTCAIPASPESRATRDNGYRRVRPTTASGTQ